MDWQPLIVLVQRQVKEYEMFRDALKELEKLGQAENRITLLRREEDQLRKSTEVLQQQNAAAAAEREQRAREYTETMAKKKADAERDFATLMRDHEGKVAGMNIQLTRIRDELQRIQEFGERRKADINAEIAGLTAKRDSLQQDMDQLAARFVRS